MTFNSPVYRAPKRALRASEPSADLIVAVAEMFDSLASSCIQSRDQILLKGSPEKRQLRSPAVSTTHGSLPSHHKTHIAVPFPSEGTPAQVALWLRDASASKEHELAHVSSTIDLMSAALSEREQWLTFRGYALEDLDAEHPWQADGNSTVVAGLCLLSQSGVPPALLSGRWCPTESARERVAERVEERLLAAHEAAEAEAARVRASHSPPPPRPPLLLPPNATAEGTLGTALELAASGADAAERAAEAREALMREAALLGATSKAAREAALAATGATYAAGAEFLDEMGYESERSLYGAGDSAGWSSLAGDLDDRALSLGGLSLHSAHSRASGAAAGGKEAAHARSAAQVVAAALMPPVRSTTATSAEGLAIASTPQAAAAAATTATAAATAAATAPTAMPERGLPPSALVNLRRHSLPSAETALESTADRKTASALVGMRRPSVVVPAATTAAEPRRSLSVQWASQAAVKGSSTAPQGATATMDGSSATLGAAAAPLVVRESAMLASMLRSDSGDASRAASGATAGAAAGATAAAGGKKTLSAPTVGGTAASALNTLQQIAAANSHGGRTKSAPPGKGGGVPSSGTAVEATGAAAGEAAAAPSRAASKSGNASRTASKSGNASRTASKSGGASRTASAASASGAPSCTGSGATAAVAALQQQARAALEEAVRTATGGCSEDEYEYYDAYDGTAVGAEAAAGASVGVVVDEGEDVEAGESAMAGLSAANDEAEEARAAVAAAVASEDAAVARLEAAEAAVEMMREQRAALDAALDAVRQVELELKAARAEEEGLGSMVTRNDEALDDAQRALERHRKKRLGGAKERAELERHVADETAKLEAAEAKLHAAQDRVTQLMGDVERLAMRCEEMQQELETGTAQSTSQLKEAHVAREAAEAARQDAEVLATNAAAKAEHERILLLGTRVAQGATHNASFAKPSNSAVSFLRPRAASVVACDAALAFATSAARRASAPSVESSSTATAMAAQRALMRASGTNGAWGSVGNRFSQGGAPASNGAAGACGSGGATAGRSSAAPPPAEPPGLRTAAAAAVAAAGGSVHAPPEPDGYYGYSDYSDSAAEDSEEVPQSDVPAHS